MTSGSFRAEEPELQIPVDKPSAAVIAVRTAVAESLSSIKPKARAEPSSFVTHDGRFILHGDFFGSGGHCALLEVAVASTEGQNWGERVVSFARIESGKWELTELWNISPVWRPEGWKSNDEDYLPVTPAELPFKLTDLSGDGVPEVVVAGEVNKYYQAYYLFRYQSQPGRLEFVASAMAEPKFVGGYVRLDNNSGRRAIWSESEFCQWQGDKLVQKALWHDEAPYNNTDAPFILATRMSARGEKLEFRIEGTESDAEMESAYKITREERPFAKMTFKWSKPLTEVVGDTYDAVGSEYAYLFEKLTGLSRQLYPGANKDRPVIRLEKLAKVRVEGEPAAMEMLSPEKK